MESLGVGDSDTVFVVRYNTFCFEELIPGYQSRQGKRDIQLRTTAVQYNRVESESIEE